MIIIICVRVYTFLCAYLSVLRGRLLSCELEESCLYEYIVDTLVSMLIYFDYSKSK